LKLVSHPPLQLLLARSSLASLPNVESGAGDGVRAADEDVVDDRRDPAVLAARSGLIGFATGFGASTVTGGSVLVEPAVICDAAGPHSKAVDKTARAEGTTKLDDSLITMSFPNPERKYRPVSAVTYIPN